MDFLFLNNESQAVIDFNRISRIISKDKFFERAQRYISTDMETLLHRQALFSDILKNDGLSVFLFALLERLTEYSPLMKNKQASSNEEKFNIVLYPIVYIELVGFIYENLSSFYSNITSESLKHLYELSKNDIKSDEYTRIKYYYEKNINKLRSVNSVTIGINLDALCQPKEAGILSLNKEEFKSGDLIDRIVKLDFEKDEYHCIAPITVINKKLGFQESQLVNFAFLNAMGKVVDIGLRHCNTRILNYIREKLSNYFEYFDSLSFVVEAIRRIKIFEKKNIPLCFPQISKDRSFKFVALYDNELCYTKDKKDIVPSTVTLDSNICCYILTGPNSGGKTVFLNSLACAQYYFQLGMPIPAKEATLPICDAIFKISVDEQANATSVGRFEKECISLSEILRKFTNKSLALIDEAFSSTSSTEAIPIAANYISELCMIGGKCIFITHHHELCETQPSIAKCGEKIGYLHTEMFGDRRTFAIQKGKAKIRQLCTNYCKKIWIVKITEHQ